jgi:hypothetical protein
LDFRIVDSALMRDLRRRRGIHANPWSHFPRLITSIDFIKRERPGRLFRETIPAPGEPIYWPEEKEDKVYTWVSRRKMVAQKIVNLWKFKENEIDIWIRSRCTAEPDCRMT